MNAVDGGLFAVLLLLMLKIIFRKQSLAALAFVVINWIMFSQVGDVPTNVIIIRAILGLISTLIFLAVIMKFGLLSYIVAVFVYLVVLWPMTTDTSAWYFGTGAGVLAVILAMAAYGSYTSLGNKPAVRAS